MWYTRKLGGFGISIIYIVNVPNLTFFLVYHILSQSNKTRQTYHAKHVVETCYKTLLSNIL